MFIGRSYNSLDTQRRVTVPKQMRGELGEHPILTRGLDGGLFLLPEGFWQSLVNNLTHQPFTKKRSRDFLRLMSNDATEVAPDKLGRITIPESLSGIAGVKRDVVVVGSLQYIEIWDRDQYHAYQDEIEPQKEAIAESMEWESDAYSSHA